MFTQFCVCCIDSQLENKCVDAIRIISVWWWIRLFVKNDKRT